MEAKQASMSFEGEDPENPLQIEADEGAFGLEDPGEKEPGTAVVFNEYVGVMILCIWRKEIQVTQCLVEHALLSTLPRSGFLFAQEQGHHATNL